MKKRVITAIAIIAVVVCAFLLREVNNYIFDALFCMVIIIAANEVARVFNRSGRLNNSLLITIYPILSYVGFFLCLQNNIPVLYSLLISLAIIVVLMLVEMVNVLFTKKQLKVKFDELKTQKSFTIFCTNKVLLTGFIMLYPSMILSSIYYLNHITDIAYLNLSATFANFNLSLFLLLMTIVTTVATDTFAYFVGSSLKGPKLCPLISPNKTISGAIGGLLGSVIFGFGVYGIFTALGLAETLFPIHLVVIYTILASIVSQVGDIFASVIKRRARTKDYSSVFPGHGGFMDRLDGISFNAIFSLVFFMLFIL